MSSYTESLFRIEQQQLRDIKTVLTLEPKSLENISFCFTYYSISCLLVPQSKCKHCSFCCEFFDTHKNADCYKPASYVYHNPLHM